MKHRLMWLSLGVFLVALLDQITKKLAVNYLKIDDPPINLIPGLIDLKLLFNSGISFGIFSHGGSTLGWVLLSVFTFLIILYLSWSVFKHLPTISLLGLFSFCLILGGAVGNAIDRVIYRQVTDFMLFRLGDRLLFINNFADDAISIGIILLFFETFILRTKNSTLRNIFASDTK